MKVKLKDIFKIIILYCGLLSLVSCWPPADRYVAVTSLENDEYIKATVVKFNFDGCTWMLRLENQKQLEPVNLKEEFKKDNLNVWVKYESYSGPGICMSGPMVKIKEIKERK